MNKKKFSKYVKDFDFKKLFIDLGWDNYSSQIPVTADEVTFEIRGIVEKRGFVIVLCPASADGEIPLSKTRKKIEHNFRKFHQEHLIIYADKAKTKQIWQFVIQEPDKPKKTREIQYSKDQYPEILFQRARGLLFTLDEEENITLVDVIARFKKNFAKNTETITKKFYTEFKKRHNAFLDFISGIDDAIADKENKNKQWYASLMLNRLMFCYFIQKRGYLDNNIHYLSDKLKEVKSKAGQNKFYSFYRDFLLELFHKGLGQPEKKRKLSVDLGNIPYLNGGLFDVHELERQFDEIDIKDAAFEKIFNFFDQWNWHLDTRVEASGKDINPDVIGYIFEKYINDRAAMGAYYTKEDITDYIGKNTIIPFLFDKVKKAYPEAFKADGFIWSFLKASGDTYIYDAVKKGVPQKGNEDGNGDLFGDLPEEIKAGFLSELEKKAVKDLSEKHLWEIRRPWNKKAPPEIALPTEIYREVIERRKRYAKIKAKIENGEITQINDFITYNLNIRQFTQDILENTDDPDFIRHFYKALKSVTILDPTCGSGAFLFAALNILEPLYETCIERMEQFTAETPRKYKFFHETLAEVNSKEHPNLGYYIYKTIILNNLYGVDIMREAVEIAKLRLFLKMVGAVDINLRKPNYGLEPLPDVDFNIRAGNTLVGFATEEELKDAIKYEDDTLRMGWEQDFKKFEEECGMVATAFKRFQDSQLIMDKGEDTHRKAKVELQKRLDDLNKKLNEYLAFAYGINKERQKKKYAEWLDSHQPFHWFAEFYEIINGNGGFDVVIGNPPYVEQKKINYNLLGYKTISCGNMYAYIIERNKHYLSNSGKTSMIIPHSAFCTDRMQPLLKIFQTGTIWTSTYDIRPSKLFNGVDQRLAIYLHFPNSDKTLIGTTQYNRWNEEMRPSLFENLEISINIQSDIGSVILKAGCILEEKIYNKLSDYKILGYNISGSNGLVYYHNAPRYFIRAMLNPPYFWNERDGEKVSVQVKTLSFDKKGRSGIVGACLNSSLFYWWFIMMSDSRHLNLREIKTFPITLSNCRTLLNLEQINGKLMTDFKKHSFRKECYYQSTGNVIYDEYYPKYSKPIIDQIDTILAQHYNFTEEELDFIINYDIKYRMGKELDAYIEGSLGKKNGESN